MAPMSTWSVHFFNNVKATNIQVERTCISLIPHCSRASNVFFWDAWPILALFSYRFMHGSSHLFDSKSDILMVQTTYHSISSCIILIAHELLYHLMHHDQHHQQIFTRHMMHKRRCCHPSYSTYLFLLSHLYAWIMESSLYVSCWGVFLPTMWMRADHCVYS